MARNIEIKLRGEIRQLKASLKQARAEIQNLKKDVDKSKKGFTDFRNVVGVALGLELGNIISGATRLMTEFARDSIVMAADMEMAWQAFTTRLGDTSEVMLDEMRKASRGMVSDLNLVKSANRALILGLEKNQLPELMEIARVRAKFMGVTVTKAFDDITLGIGRQSRLILDNLGIIVNVKKEYESFARSIGKTREELSEYEKRQAIANAVMRNSAGDTMALGESVLTAKENWQRFTASIDNWKQSKGDEFIDMIDRIAFLTSDMYKEMDAAGASAEEMVTAFENWRVEVKDAEEDVSALSEELRVTNAEMNEVINSLRGFGKTTTLEGEREKTLEILRKEKELSQAELELLRMQEVPLAKKAELEQKIAEGKRMGSDVSALEDIVADIEKYEEQEEKVRDLKKELKELRLEKKTEFELVKEIEEERAEIKADELEGIKTTKEEFKKMVDAKVENYYRLEEERQNLLEDQQKEIDNMLTIRDLSGGQVLARHRGEKILHTPIPTGPIIIPEQESLPSETRVQDAIVKPSGQVIRFDPRDTAILSKELPEFGPKEIILKNVIMLDGREIARSVGRYDAERLKRSGF